MTILDTLKALTIKGRFIHQSRTGTEIILHESGGRERFISSLPFSELQKFGLGL
jgi:hypothetical protein